MSGVPPDWDDVPPHDPGDYGRAAPSGGRPYKSNKPAAMTAEQLANASADFWEWLNTPATIAQLKIMLPEHVDADVFIATAKTAVLTKPELLREDLRQSLLASIMKAAGQGLLPDGKQGALIARYDTEARKYQIAWQPMVQGIMKLGRETGSIRHIRAVIVFHGETFRIIQGDEDRIEHEVDIDIVEEAYAALNNGRDDKGNPRARPDEFFARVRAAYCVVTGVDGTVTKRWMTRGRLLSLWESSKAANGPWNSRWIDEMILKGMILLTAKWLNLDGESVQAKRFQAALMTDMEIDFDRQGQPQQIEAPSDRMPQAALLAPADKLGNLEDAMSKTKVPARTTGVVPPTARNVPGAQGGGERIATPAPPAAPKLPDDAPFIDRATAALTVDNGIGHRWMKALTFATTNCQTSEDLRALHIIPSVRKNQTDAPPAVRSQIAALFKEAAERLGNVGADAQPAGNDDDGWSGPREEDAA